MQNKIALGDKVRDTVTGYTGIAVAKTEWLNGCFRWLIQAPVDKEGKVPDNLQVDEHQIEVVETKQHAPLRETGGPRPNVAAPLKPSR